LQLVQEKLAPESMSEMHVQH